VNRRFGFNGCGGSEQVPVLTLRTALSEILPPKEARAALTGRAFGVAKTRDGVPDALGS
jgi:hypothetical protein